MCEQTAEKVAFREAKKGDLKKFSNSRQPHLINSKRIRLIV